MIGPAPSRPVREISAPKVRKGEPGSVRLQGGRQAPSRGPGPQETPGGRGSGTLDKPRLDALALFPSLCFTSPLREHTPQPRMEPTARMHSCLSGRSTMMTVTHGSDAPLQWQPRTALRLQNGGPAPARRAAGVAAVQDAQAPAWPLTHRGGVWPRKGRERPAWARKEMVQVAGLRAAL